MREIQLVAEADGSVSVSGGNGGSAWQQRASAGQVRAVRSAAAALLDGFESGHSPLADPVALADLGHALRDTFVTPLYAAGTEFPGQGEGRLLFVSAVPCLLNLPWELLPGRDGQFLVADAGMGSSRSPTRKLWSCACFFTAKRLQIKGSAASKPRHPGLRSP